MTTNRLLPGDLAPWFYARGSTNPRYDFASVAGCYIVLCFFGSAADPLAAEVLARFRKWSRFDDAEAAFFGVSEDPADEAQARVADRVPGVRYFWDAEAALRKLYGLEDGERATFVLDIALRVIAVLPFGQDAARHVAAVTDVLRRQPPPRKLESPAPVLVIPGVFEPELCRRLVAYFETKGGKPSGFMREEEGVTVARMDVNFKRRSDCVIEDQALREECVERIGRRLAPHVRRAFQFNPTRIERYIVSCYDAKEAGAFRAHRDNTTRGTAHRRFAVSLFLNTGEYRGGELCFPEYGPRRYGAPAGGAVVFSCSILHEALPVTKGQRYMFLPFLYDEEAAALRERNMQFVEASRQGYKAQR